MQHRSAFISGRPIHPDADYALMRQMELSLARQGCCPGNSVKKMERLAPRYVNAFGYHQARAQRAPKLKSCKSSFGFQKPVPSAGGFGHPLKAPPAVK
jgi:hypothetical protein